MRPDPLAAASDLPLPGRRFVGDGHRPLAPQERAGDRARRREQVLQGAAGDDLAAVLPGRRADVDDPVGRPDGLLVVLHDDERVAQVAQPHERGDELRVVLLVEPDGGLVEDVQDAHQAGADLGRQPDALCLAAREGEQYVLVAEERSPAEAQIAELESWVRNGQIRYREDILDGVSEQAPGSIAGLYRGENLGRPIRIARRGSRLEFPAPRKPDPDALATLPISAAPAPLAPP